MKDNEERHNARFVFDDFCYISSVIPCSEKLIFFILIFSTYVKMNSVLDNMP